MQKKPKNACKNALASSSVSSQVKVFGPEFWLLASHWSNSSTASEKCHQEKRKTVNGEDILFAMTSLGFENYSEALKIYLAKYREVSQMTVVTPAHECANSVPPSPYMPLTNRCIDTSYQRRCATERQTWQSRRVRRSSSLRIRSSFQYRVHLPSRWRKQQSPWRSDRRWRPRL